jgi:hypothetical protein
VLGLLAEVAAERLLICVVDDAQAPGHQPRTVEWHLARMFGKRDIASRMHL